MQEALNLKPYLHVVVFTVSDEKLDCFTLQFNQAIAEPSDFCMLSSQFQAQLGKDG